MFPFKHNHPCLFCSIQTDYLHKHSRAYCSAIPSKYIFTILNFPSLSGVSFSSIINADTISTVSLSTTTTSTVHGENGKIFPMGCRQNCTRECQSHHGSSCRSHSDHCTSSRSRVRQLRILATTMMIRWHPPTGKHQTALWTTPSCRRRCRSPYLMAMSIWLSSSTRSGMLSPRSRFRSVSAQRSAQQGGYWTLNCFLLMHCGKDLILYTSSLWRCWESNAGWESTV
jgi:hypothetical protein